MGESESCQKIETARRAIGNNFSMAKFTGSPQKLPMASIAFKTLSGESFTSEFDPQSTISSVKSYVQSTQPQFQSGVDLHFKGRRLADSEVLLALDISDRDFIVIRPSVRVRGSPPRGVETAPAAPLGSPIDQRFARRVNRAKFDADAGQLMDLGFPREECEAALRAAYGNPDRAAGFLVSGQIPREPDPLVAGFEEMRQLLIANPGALEHVVRLYEIIDPETGVRYRNHAEELVQDLTLDPQAFDLAAVRGSRYSIVEKAIDALSVEERRAVERLQAAGEFGQQIVIKVFYAADKDEALADSLLFSIPAPYLSS
jgi:UV excision repair protein RAD23